MDFKLKVRRKIERKPEFENLELLYPHNIMLYSLPPIQEIKLQEFEDLALERLKVLRIFEQASLKNLRFLSDEYKENITAELNREGLKGYSRLLNGNAGTKKDIDLQARRHDYISHFILRIAYCRSDDLRRWFMKHEMDIFRYKFASLTTNEIKQFLEINKMINYIPLTEEQKNDVKDGLYESTVGQSNSKIELLDFYKVHFTEVLDLVKNRKCYLKNGFAYVNTHDFVSIVAVKYQAEIEYGLQITQEKLLPVIQMDERLHYLTKSFINSYTGKDYTLSRISGGVPIESLEQLMKKSYPLCMRMCHESLLINNHLKYGGRQQYGLFLKGIGVTLADSLRFWREEFTKKNDIDLDKFEKKYSYNIRHNYGKEGSKINLSPKSCLTIITQSIGQNETHGCPFRHMDPSTLKLKISSYGISPTHVQDIMSYVQRGHFQLACTKYFEISHDVKLEQGINHPNQYFEESQKTMVNKEPTRSGGTTTNLNNSQNSSIIKGRKSTSTTYKKNSETLMDADDDDELWNTVETQEKNNKSDWEDEDFDITLVENIEY